MKFTPRVHFRRLIGNDPSWVIAQTLLFGCIALAGPVGHVRSRGRVKSAATPPVAIGAALIAGGLGLAARARRDLGESFTMSPTPLAEARLVASGVYGRIRHPMYASALAIAAGYALAWTSRAAAAGTLLAGAYIGLKIRHEERRLRQRYPGYDAYAREVRWRVIPGVF